MRRHDVGEIVEAQRRSLAELLDRLDDEEWQLPSLCVGWRVCDVAAHLTLGTDVGVVRGGWELARARGDVNRMIHDTAIRRANERDRMRIVADLRTAASSRRHPPGTSFLDPLADILVHAQDIAVPLGRQWDVPGRAATVAATHDYRKGFPFHARRRFAGLRLEATDVGWVAGDGPAVRGPIAALLLVITGRPAGLAQLTGAGCVELATRLLAPAGTMSSRRPSAP